MLEVHVWAQVIRFGTFSNTVGQCTCMSSLDRVDEHPVLLADTEWFDGSFAGRVIDWNIAIIKEHFQVFIGWVIALGERVKITGPEDVVGRMKEITNRMRKQYKHVVER